MAKMMPAWTLLVFLGLGLAPLPLAAEGETLVVSLQDISCQSCGQAVTELLQRQPGIRAASFDRDAAEVTVELGDPAPAAEEILAIIHRAGYGAELGAGTGRYQPALEFPPGFDVVWISRAGEAVRIRDHLAPGKVTVIDFSAVWCGPCREVDAAMKEILAAADDVALRKINVVDWSSPIARQELRDVGALPHVEVYGKNGKRVASISGLDLERLRKAIEKGRRR